MENRIFNPNHHLQIISNLKDFFRSQSFSDCTVFCDGRQFSTHRVVLAAGSEYFKTIFNTTGSPYTNNNFIVITDMSSDIFDALLTFLYYGELKISSEKINELRLGALKLRIKGILESPLIDCFERIKDEDDRNLVIDEHDENVLNDTAESSVSPSNSGNATPDSDKENLNEDADAEDNEYDENFQAASNFLNINPANFLQQNNYDDFNTSANPFCGNIARILQQMVFQSQPNVSENEKKKFACNACEKSYAWKSGLYKHKRSTHPTKTSNESS